ncbi:MAG: polysaccharide deacetylase family protein [Parafilimonas sp.]
MLLIYTPYITTRIEYIMQYVFGERLGIEYLITNNKEQYHNNNEVLKIIYAGERLDEGLYFFAEKLLFENDIKEIELNEGAYKNIKTIFSHTENTALNFDVFAAIFYLLSRYEEYLNKPLAEHGNYDYKNSILHKLNVLDTPVVEQWIEILKDVLRKNSSSLQFKNHKPKFGLSFDIDVAYAYKARSFARTAGGIFKKVAALNFSEAKNQLLTLMNKKEDMFDTYDYIFSSIKNKKPVFFFDMGLYGKFDKNPSWKNKKFRKLIKNISEKAVLGLHPSYASNKNKNLLAIEKNKLEQITGNSIAASRQHYLKLKFPYTYNCLIENNIKEDFTMGYYYTYGFRAGTCNSFLFFDLIKNEATALRLYPFAYMDGSLNDVLKMNIEQAKKTVSKLIDTTNTYNGIFIPLWHNSTLCNCNEWKGWREVFEHTIKEIENKNFENLFN